MGDLLQIRLEVAFAGNVAVTAQKLAGVSHALLLAADFTGSCHVSMCTGKLLCRQVPKIVTLTA